MEEIKHYCAGTEKLFVLNLTDFHEIPLPLCSTLAYCGELRI